MNQKSKPSSKTKSQRNTTHKKTSTSSKDRYKVNFKNKKVQNVISRLEICEGRLSKGTFLNTTSKDIFYQMLHSGYIKQKGDTIIATPKLRSHVSNTKGTHFSSSCSIEHSYKIESSLALLPQSVLDKRSYTTQSDLEVEYKRAWKTNPSYKSNLDALKATYSSSMKELVSMHQNFSSSDNVTTFQEKLNFENTYKDMQSKLHILDEEPILIPDFRVRLNEEELNTFLNNLTSLRDSTLEERERSLYSNAIDTLKELCQSKCLIEEGEITLCIEVTTNHYHEREYFKHQNYSVITSQSLIMI